MEPSDWWTAFWVFFAFLWLMQLRFGVLKIIFYVQFWALLILMRTSDNQMAHNCWVAMWLSFFSLGGACLAFQMPQEAYSFLLLILVAVRFFAIGPAADGSDYEMPTATFWVLTTVLAPAVLIPFSRGGFIWLVIVLYNVYLRQDGIHIPGVLISWWVIMATVAVVLLISNAITFPGYVPAVLVYFVVVGVLRNQMWPYNEAFGWGWAGAWFLLFHAILYAFAPSMPILWYVFFASTIVGLGYAFRPDESLHGFVFWALSIWVLRVVLFVAYMLYFRGGADTRATMFPFNLFSHTWQSSKQRWFPLSQRPLDSLNSTVLCERCQSLTSESALIMGSSSFLTRMVEWHDDFWTREQFLARFAVMPPADVDGAASAGIGPSSSSAAPGEANCRLCSVLFYSMSLRRRDAFISSIASQYRTETWPGGDARLPAPQDPEAELRVKIWDERPLSLFTYVQLFWGDVAVGTRLLVHRGDLFVTPSPAIGYSKTNSAEHFAQARKWLELCKTSHSVCRGVGNTERALPARILYVSSGEHWRPGTPPETIKLVQTSDVDLRSTEYLALSHCWGPTAEMQTKLLASNIDACYATGFDFSSLSQNLQDAITTTLRLGFSYVWIDSLCIIQRDTTGQEAGAVAEVWKLDWATEAKKMGSVYSGAACTIASTGSASSSGGCFHDRSVVALAPCKIGVSSCDALVPDGWIYARRDDVFDFERGVDLSPLNTRGWVMQERLLSRRILHFGADMLYWECCARSASELNPHGYRYKRYPEDFTNNYMPDVGQYLKTRGDVERAEHEGRGLSWANEEKRRRRPPPVMLDPDSPLNSQSVWQQKRSFWKNVLKSTDESWAQDEKEESDSAERPRAGFRAAFELLRQGLVPTAANSTEKEARVGRYSFSQAWYDVVESYSRGQLTAPTDKLIAMKGIEDEVARATKFTYLYGLWRERLVTDLLWFAIEGPGKRLTRGTPPGDPNQEDDNGSAPLLLPPVAPTWSWASIEGAVALDLLPEDSRTDIDVADFLVTVHAVSSEGGSGSDSGSHGDRGSSSSSSQARVDPWEMSIELSGPLLPIAAPTFDGTTFSISLGKMGQAAVARFFPDVRETDVCQMDGLACLTFLALDRSKRTSLVSFSSEDIQGLVLRLVRRSGESRTAAPTAATASEDSEDRTVPSVDVYERVGYFTTSYIAKSQAARRGRKLLKDAEVQRLCLAGWSGYRGVE